jgi:hypothetical protein
MMIPWRFLALAALVASTFACGNGDGPANATKKPPAYPPAAREQRASKGQFVYADTFPQVTDHDAASATAFAQRYFVDSTYAKGKSTAPVLFWICAEGPCGADQMLGALQIHAQKLGAHMVALEHRFYGKSFPAADVSTSSLRLLSVEQALADLANFVTFMKTVEGLTGKWIAFGGSYSGALSAYLRATRPELIDGAIETSGPVRAKEAFEEYDAHVAQDLGTDCAAAMRKLVGAVDDVMESDAARFDEIRALFGTDASSDKYYFGTLLNYPLSGMAQYGIPSRDEICAALQAEDPLASYAALARGSNGAAALAFASPWQPLANDGTDVTNTEIPDEATEGGRMWLYQTCKQFGFWPVAHHDRSVSVFSKFQTLAYYRGTCAYLFDLTQPAAAEQTNARYYDHLISGAATKILYTNGSADPWSELSILTAPAGSETYLIEGGHHCDDIFAPAATDSSSLQGARAKVAATIAGWLK